MKNNTGATSDEIYFTGLNLVLSATDLKLGSSSFVSGGDATFAANMVQNGNSITVTLGNRTGGSVATVNNSTMTWRPSANAKDLAGKASATTTVTETTRPGLLMRPIATLVMSIAMAFAAIGLAVAAPGGLIGGDRELASAEIQAASGAVHIANNRAGHAVFSADGMRPGESVSGAVTIGNDGDRPGQFAVRPTGLDDVAPNGGKLSERVELVLFDITNLQNPKTIYAGVPKDFHQKSLGVIAPGQERDYLFAATLPDGEDDNQYQGAALSLGFEWSAVTVAADPTTTTPTPTTPPVADTRAHDPDHPHDPDDPHDARCRSRWLTRSACRRDRAA